MPRNVKNKLSSEMRRWRAERPDEWKMDEFIRESIELEARIEELRILFELQRKRTVDADKLWQKAHNKPNVWPDLGKLIEWLLENMKKENKAK